MKSRTVAIIQARMGSKRLPGKVLQPLGGESVLGHVVKRTQAATRVDDVVVATSTRATDLGIADECDRLGVKCYRGPELDVLSRFNLAAGSEDATTVVRITADCPFVSPEIIDEVIESRERSSADYASNTLERTFPLGLDVECFSVTALASASRLARSSEEREHVTPYIYNHAEEFLLASVSALENYSFLRLTLDREEDLSFMRHLVDCCPVVVDPSFPWKNLVTAVQGSALLRDLQRRARSAARSDVENLPLK